MEKVNKDGVYVSMPVTVHKPTRKAGTGHGPEQAKNSKDEDAKEDSRALTKVKFKKPMEELGRALEQCRKELTKNNQQNMLKHVYFVMHSNKHFSPIRFLKVLTFCQIRGTKTVSQDFQAMVDA